ncbi:MAG: FG-GAP repeat protein, partial [Phycisphaerales bacterium]
MAVNFVAALAFSGDACIAHAEDDVCFETKFMVSGSPNHLAGTAVETRGKHVLIGAPRGHNGGYPTGVVRVFQRTPNGWMAKTRLAPPGVNLNDGPQFGHALALSGDTLVVGAPYD